MAFWRRHANAEKKMEANGVVSKLEGLKAEERVAGVGGTTKCNASRESQPNRIRPPFHHHHHHPCFTLPCNNCAPSHPIPCYNLPCKGVGQVAESIGRITWCWRVIEIRRDKIKGKVEESWRRAMLFLTKAFLHKKHTKFEINQLKTAQMVVNRARVTNTRREWKVGYTT